MLTVAFSSTMLLMRNPRISTTAAASATAFTAGASSSLFLFSSARTLATAAAGRVKKSKELTPAQAARKKIKALGQPELARPKGRLTPYFIFSNEIRPEVVRELGTKHIAPVAKETGAKWRALSAEEKEPYFKKSDQDKVRYDRELAHFVATRPASDAVLEEKVYRLKKKLAEISAASSSSKSSVARKPKLLTKPIKDEHKPQVLSAYQLFAQTMWRGSSEEQIKALGQDSVDAKDFVAKAKLIASKWRSMSDQEKEPFQRQSDKLHAASRAYSAKNGLDEYQKSLEKTVKTAMAGRKKRVLGARKTKPLKRTVKPKKPTKRSKAVKKRVSKTKKTGDTAVKAVKAVKKGAKKVTKSIKRGAKAAKTVSKRVVKAAVE
ncbi:Non-histone chromosomal protein 6 [Geranomyces variabilis]|nr:Non-histone chromosomal protein 6 [Geranomyces variabilis]